MLNKYLITLLACLLAHTSFSQIYVYANATGANNGSSWADAYTNLNNAINSSPTNATLWVSKGTYTPDFNTGNRDYRFQVKNGQKIYGGFPIPNPPSFLPTFADRDVDNNETILSGEIGAAGNADNSIHVVIIADVYNVILDGFTIQDGNANDDSFWWGHQGGGLLMSYWNTGTNLSPPCQVLNCKFQNNAATWGGGGGYIRAGNDGSIASKFEPIFENCIFENNTSANRGGGLMLDSANPDMPITGNATLTNCQFLTNTAAETGGALSIGAWNGGTATHTLTGCSFTGNIAVNNAGAIEVNTWTNGSDATNFTNCTFTNNKVNNWTGGAIRYNADLGGTLTGIIDNCTFTSNGDETADETAFGGAIGMECNTNGVSTMQILNTAFTGNYCKWDGGAIYMNSRTGGNCSPTIDNCNFTNNTALNGGGAGLFLYADGGAVSPSISNCTFDGGTTENGGGICLYPDFNSSSTMNPSIDNCEFTNNTAYDGGGIYITGWNNTDVKPTISNCEFISNTSTHNGGGVYNKASDKTAGAPSFEPVYTDCKFNSNTAPLGGGSYNTGHNSSAAGLCKPKYERCTFMDNSATDFYSGSFKAGSAAYNNGYGGFVEAEYVNCIMLQFDNSSTGALVLGRGTNGGTDNSKFIHCTLSSNQEERVLYKDYSDAHFYNSVLLGSGQLPAENIPAEAPADYSDNGVVVDASNPLGTNTNGDPVLQYSWPLSADYNVLSCTSSIIDPPNPPAVTLSALDFHGNERVGVNDENRYPDAGAIEFGGKFSSAALNASGYNITANMRLYYPDGWSYLVYCNASLLTPILGVKDLTPTAIPGQNDFEVTSYGQSGEMVDLSNADYVTNPDGFEVFERYWDVQSPYSVPSGGQSVRFFYHQSDLTLAQNHLNVSNVQDLVFFKVSGTNIAPDNECVLNCGGSYTEYTFASNGVPTTDKYIYGQFGATLIPYAEYKVTSFSGGGGGAAPGGGGALDGALPLELQSFTGKKLAKENLLEWTTLAEQQTSRHFIERSIDAREWTTIGTLAAAGDSDEKQHYQLSDQEPLPFAYYRLGTEDRNGAIQFSDIIQLRRDKTDNGIDLYPQPAKNFVNLSIPGLIGSATIRIYHLNGQLVQEQEVYFSEDNWRLSVAELPTGTYIIQAQNATQLYTEKLILR